MAKSPLLPLMGLVLLTACAERPDGIPAPRPGLLRGAQACPDLVGSYALKTPGGSWAWGGEVLSQALERSPGYHSVLVVESLDEDKMVLRTQATQEDMQKAFSRWRNGQPYQYALWRHSLRARSTAEGVLLEKDPSKDPPNPAKQFPAARTFEISGVHYQCKRGWLVFKGEDEPDVNNLRWAKVRMTRAKGGGVVGRAKFSFEQTFSVWCGDSCRPNISLPDGHRERWWHAEAIEGIGTPRIDWKAILDSDHRPAEIRNRYQDGTLLRYLRQEEPEDPTEPSAPPPPPKALIYDCPEQQRTLEGIVQPQLRITEFSCTDTHCSVAGTAQSHRSLSDALRALDEQGVDGVELELIEQQSPEHARFKLRVSRQSGVLKEGPDCQALP